MLTMKHFLTREGLGDLLSVATYGNGWPVIKTYKSDSEAGLFDDCEYCEDKWAKALLKGKGIVVYDLYDEDDDCNPVKHYLTIDNIKEGLKLMKEQYPRQWADLVEENDDLITGDCFLQLAVFGEWIYG